MDTQTQRIFLKEFPVHTGAFCSCFFWWLAGLASPNSVACQDSKLVFHPRVQVYYCSCQMAASNHLRNWHKTHSAPPFSFRKLYVWFFSNVFQKINSSRLSSSLTDPAGLHHRGSCHSSQGQTTLKYIEKVRKRRIPFKEININVITWKCSNLCTAHVTQLELNLIEFLQNRCVLHVCIVLEPPGGFVLQLHI